MTAETKAAFARRHAVNRSTVNKWEARGHLVMTADGLVDVDASEAQLSGRSSSYRGGQAKGPVAQRAAAKPVTRIESGEAVMSALSSIVRGIGARVASRAIEFGAPLKVAYALDVAACLEAAEIGESYLAALGAPLPAGCSLVEITDTDGSIAEPDWPSLAERTGAPLDLDAIEQWFSQLPYPNAPTGAAHG